MRLCILGPLKFLLSVSLLSTGDKILKRWVQIHSTSISIFAENAHHLSCDFLEFFLGREEKFLAGTWFCWSGRDSRRSEWNPSYAVAYHWGTSMIVRAPNLQTIPLLKLLSPLPQKVVPKIQHQTRILHEDF